MWWMIAMLIGVPALTALASWRFVRRQARVTGPFKDIVFYENTNMEP